MYTGRNFLDRDVLHFEVEKIYLVFFLFDTEQLGAITVSSADCVSPPMRFEFSRRLDL